MRNLNTVRPLALAYLGLLGGCTVISGVNDYEVVDPLSDTRDLDYSFVGMVAHAAVALDVAVVDENNLLQARARIILPPAVADYPSERLVLRNGLTAGEQTLYFFADNNGNGLVDGSKDRIVEHIWIEEVNPDGVGEFVHNTNFIYFNEKSYTPLNGALVLQMPDLPSGEELDPVQRAFLACVERKLGDRVDVALTLVEQDRQVGLLRRHKGTPYPEEFKLSGVLDGGSKYKIEVLVDDVVKKGFERTAPVEGDLVVPTGDWFPVSINDCTAK